MFAKLFDSEKHGQILAKSDKDSKSQNPEIRFYFKPELEVFYVSFEFEANDRGFQERDKAFLDVDLEVAESMVEMAKSKISLLL